MIEHPVDVVVQHPRIVALGRTPAEQRRVEAFAIDLARWLHGEPREGLAPLARVVTVVAQRELRDPRTLCRGRPLLAVEAAARAVESLWPLLRGELEPEEPPPPPEGGGSGAGAGSGDGDEDGESEGEGEGQDEDDDDGEEAPAEPDISELLAALAGQDDIDDPELDALAEQLQRAFGGGDAMDVGAAAGDVLSEASDAALQGAMASDKVARKLENFLPGVGWSSSPGQLEGTLLERLDRLSTLIEHIDAIEELADALGRMEEPEDDGPDDGGREEVVGVRLGGHVADALPSELALLSDPDTEDLFYQRLIEQRLVSLELSGSGIDGVGGGQKRGPVIACIDTSGSMEGAPELLAKALVLALCRRVLPEGRTVHLMLFSSRTDQVEIRLRRGLGGLEGLLDFLAMAFHGGTDFDAPLERALALLDERELNRADILVVTDGLARASTEIVDAVAHARTHRNLRVWSAILGHHDAFGVRPFSDHIWRLDRTTLDQVQPLLGSLHSPRP